VKVCQVAGHRCCVRPSPAGGEPGEDDRVVPPSPRSRYAYISVRGGADADRLIGGTRPDTLLGGGGADSLAGGSGGDLLSAAIDFDRPAAVPEITADRLVGGRGEDSLYGSNGGNHLYGGLGKDSMVGFGGDDRIDARESSADEVRCGPGRDRALLSATDFFVAIRADVCESVRRPVPGSAMQLGGSRDGPTFFDPAGTQRGAHIKVACPAEAGRVCRGVARLVSWGRVLAAGAFSVGKSRARFVRLRITSLGRRVVCPHQPRAVAVVTSKDRFGSFRTTRVRGNRLICE
jgi:hypothetical protein